ncbi:MAG: L-histidine N(alpha)-methyltransferase, partial [Pedosphaera parvula]|nr:L-histidine N(alpha)-methyltransferase [Pedosphaera parvula]
MSSAAVVIIHPSQFPDRVRQDLIDSLRTRRINHKFHYDGIRQTRKWLALHEACSPARTAADCQAVYDRAFLSVAHLRQGARLHLVGLGCGGGQKDARCLEIVAMAKGSVTYTPVDVSTAMVLMAQQA